MLAGTSNEELEDCIHTKFHCLHTLVDGNYSTLRVNAEVLLSDVIYTVSILLMYK